MQSLLPVLQSLVIDRHPDLVGKSDLPQSQPEKEDMLFALLGGRVDNPPAPHQVSGSSALAVLPPHPHPVEPVAVDSHTHYWKPHAGACAVPYDPAFHTQSSFNGVVDGVDPDLDNAEAMSAMELWNRLQSFYEPTPTGWPQMGMPPLEGAVLGMSGMDGLVGGVF